MASPGLLARSLRKGQYEGSEKMQGRIRKRAGSCERLRNSEESWMFERHHKSIDC